MHATRAILWPVLVGTLLAGGQGGMATASPDVGAGAVRPAAMSLSPAGLAPTAADPRPENGAHLTDRGAKGHGALAINNGTSQDAVVTLAVGENASHAIYVHAGSDARIESIADDTYVIYVQQGTGWNNDLQQFTADADYAKFDSPATFTTIRDASGIQYTEFSITLQPVVGGNARSVPVNPEGIPK
jgi:hypothetical protein